MLAVDSSNLHRDLWLTKEAVEAFEEIYVGAFEGWEDLMVFMGFFSSKGQARKSGRTGELPQSNGWHRVGKRKFYFVRAE